MDEAIAILRVKDAARAVEWYQRLGYVQESVHRFGPSFPAFVSIARDGQARLFLSEHTGDATPDTLVYLRIPDVENVAAAFGVDVAEQDWGNEVHLTDPDGNRLRIGEPRT